MLDEAGRGHIFTTELIGGRQGDDVGARLAVGDSRLVQVGCGAITEIPRIADSPLRIVDGLHGGLRSTRLRLR